MFEYFHCSIRFAKQYKNQINVNKLGLRKSKSGVHAFLWLSFPLSFRMVIYRFLKVDFLWDSSQMQINTFH